MPTARLLRATLALATVLCAHAAAAYELRLVPTTPTTIQVGEVVTFEVYLDTEGESEITAIDPVLPFDDSRFSYRLDLSQNNDEEILYTPFGGKGSNQPPRWLEATQPAPYLGTIPGTTQVGFGFYHPTLGGTYATGTNVWMSTISFVATQPGSAVFELRFDLPPASFLLAPHDGSGVIDIGDQVSTPIVTTVTVLPVDVPVGPAMVLLGPILLGVGAMLQRRSSAPRSGVDVEAP